MIEINWKPDVRALRQFGGILTLILMGLAACAWYGLLMFSGTVEGARPALPAVLAAVGVLTAITSLVAPKAILPLYLALTLVAYPIGSVVSYLLLAVLFFFVITPIGVIRRTVRRDPFNSRLDRSVESYWVTRKSESKKTGYFGQF